MDRFIQTKFSFKYPKINIEYDFLRYYKLM